MIGDRPLPAHWFAADDMARMISAASQREEATSRKLFVHGPEAMTTVEALERYCWDGPAARAFFLGGGETFVMVRGGPAQRAPIAWQPLVRGRWLQVDGMEQV